VALGVPVETGVFCGRMAVSLMNDGPVTSSVDAWRNPLCAKLAQTRGLSGQGEFCYRSSTISSGFRVGALRPFFV
jgi:hypothetical protein